MDESETPDLFELESAEPKNQVVEYTVEELLIQCVEARPTLWDSRLPLKDRSKTLRDQCWLQIYQEFGENPEFSVDYLQKKWRNLRDTYVRLKSEYTPSGSGAKKKKKWEYYDLLTFLNDTITFRPTISNVQPSTSKSCTSPLTSPQALASPTGTSSDNETRSLGKPQKIEGAIIDALNKINSPVQIEEQNCNQICLRISEMLQVMPQRERTALEIKLLQVAYEGSKEFLL